MDALKIQIYNGQITPHFNIKEFRCRANNEMLITEDVIAHIQRLEKLRVWYKRVMIIYSGYRTPEYNALVGGAVQSKHLLGIASDIALPMHEFSAYSKERQDLYLQNVKNKWTQICNEDGLGGGVGFYDTFFHLDSRESAAFWDARTN